MKVLFITNYFEPDSGAAAIRLSRLARQLHQRGHHVTVLTSLPHYPQRKIHEGYRHRLVVVENRDGLRVIQTWLFTVENHRIIFKLMSHLTLMITMFLRGLFLPKQDVILIEAQPVFPALGGVILALLKRTPYVLNVSDLWPDHLLTVGVLTARHPVYRIFRRIVDFAYRHAAQIIAMSPIWAEKIQGYIGKSEKVHVVYNGVDLNIFFPSKEKAEFLKKYDLGEQKIVSFIGTFSTPYDFPTMMKTIQHFVAHQEIQFVFIGQGSQAELFKEYLATGDYSNVRWIHWIERDEIPQAWHASYLTYWAIGDHDLYKGTIPAKLFELMACGVPVVASMNGLTADMIQESGGGIVVPAKDLAGLIAGISRLIDDKPFHEACSRAARRYAEQHFDHEKVAQAYEHILLEAL